jgi:hypothetical protein
VRAGAWKTDIDPLPESYSKRRSEWWTRSCGPSSRGLIAAVVQIV